MMVVITLHLFNFPLIQTDIVFNEICSFEEIQNKEGVSIGTIIYLKNRSTVSVSETIREIRMSLNKYTNYERIII